MYVAKLKRPVLKAGPYRSNAGARAYQTVRQRRNVEKIEGLGTVAEGVMIRLIRILGGTREAEAARLVMLGVKMWRSSTVEYWECEWSYPGQ